MVQYHEDRLDSPTSGTASSETSPSFLSGHIDSSYGSGSFVSSSGIDDFGGDESYEASDAYSNDENSYYNENKRKNQVEERHDEYGSDSSGSFACHDEDRHSEGGIIPVFIDELKKADVHDIREVKIDSDRIRLSRTSVTVPCGGIIVWSYLRSGNKEEDLDDYSEFSRFSKFQFKKETNFSGNNQSDFILCYTSPSLRPLEESNVALCLKFCQPGRFRYECQTFSFMKGEINVLNSFNNTLASQNPIAALGIANANRRLIASARGEEKSLCDTKVLGERSKHYDGNNKVPCADTVDGNRTCPDTEVRILADGRLSPHMNETIVQKRRKRKKKKKKKKKNGVEQDNVDLEVKNDEDLLVDDTTLLEKDQHSKKSRAPR